MPVGFFFALRMKPYKVAPAASCHAVMVFIHVKYWTPFVRNSLKQGCGSGSDAREKPGSDRQVMADPSKTPGRIWICNPGLKVQSERRTWRFSFSMLSEAKKKLTIWHWILIGWEMLVMNSKYPIGRDWYTLLLLDAAYLSPIIKKTSGG